MAKLKQEAAPEAGSIESRTTVTLNSEHDNSPNLYDVKVGGRRVAYIIDEAPFPVTLLPSDTVKLKLTPDEVKKIVVHARGIIAKVVADKVASMSDLDRLLAGQ